MRQFACWTLLFMSAYGASVASQAQPRLAQDGVYTAAQALRGKSTYTVFCAGCHADDLAGSNSGDSGAPPLKHDRFMRGSTAAAIFTKIKRSMPLDAPGTLPDTDVVDVVAYLLEANGFPAGPTELPPATSELERIRIGSAPVAP